MVPKSVQKFALVVLLLFWASFAWCQKAGTSAYSAADVFANDVVDLYTLTTTINVPLVPKQNVGPLPIVWPSTMPQYCYTVVVSGTDKTTCSISGFPIASPIIDMTPIYDTTQNPQCSSGGVSDVDYTVTALLGSDGLSSYNISPVDIHTIAACGSQTATVKTIDNTGISGSVTTTVPGITTPVITSTGTSSGWTWTRSSGNLADAFGNSETFGVNPFTDILGATLTTSGNTATYVDSSGNNQNITWAYGSATTFSNTLCGPVLNSTYTPLNSITYADGTSFTFTYDSTLNIIKSFTNRNGGTITYTYGTATCGPPWEYATLSRQTPDGTTSYTRSLSNGVTTTTVKDPGLNKTIYTMGFSGIGGAFLTSVYRYQNTGSVASPSYTLISNTAYCYNTSCTAKPTGQITTYEVKSYAGTGSTYMSDEVLTYDSHGNVLTDATTDEITTGTPTITTTYVYGTDSSGTCVAITNTAVVDHPCTVTTKNGTTWLSGSTYTYNSNGALTASSACLTSTCTGTSALTTTYTPNTNGTYSAIAGPNGQSTSYTYGDCNSFLPTDVTTTVNSIAIDHKATWNCNAGVVTDTTDPNSNEADYTYDSMNRPSTYHDYMGDTNTTSWAYGTPTLDHVKVTDNIGVVSYQYVDGLGRPTVSQTCETSGCTTLDTVSHAYGWTDSMSHALTNFQTTTSGGTSSAACTTTTPGTACSTVTLTALTNPIAGPYKTTDANSGTLTFGIGFGSTGADSSVTAGPAPSGEHTKVVQTEVDGFGRVDSVCALENSGGTTCGQALGNSGILTTNTYSFATGAPKVVTTRGSQSHTTIADAVGRTSSIQTPEAGTTTYTYDSRAANYCMSYPAYTSTGDLVATNDAATNHVCYWYDGLHRVVTVGNNNEGSTNPCKQFRYDSTANGHVTAPTGYPSSGANILGRLMEAATTDSCGNTSNLLTDEWFAYDKMGRMTDMWEKTPNSGSTYYHTTVAYDSDGSVTSLTSPFSTATWGYDTEERPNSLTYGSTTIVSSTGFTYNAAGSPTNVPIGAGTNQDAYTYDQLEHMLTYTFPVSTKSDAGTLTWNSIGSLGKLVVNDTITSSTDSQTCTYAYDDVARLTSVAGASCNATQTFAYDQYDNMWQSGTYSFGCSTCYSSTSNEQTSTPTMSYDSDGNVTNDGTNTYTWNVSGKIASSRAGSFAAVCGTSGVCNTYDAAGNLVEQNSSGTTSEYLYSPIGRVGAMNGQTAVWLMVPAPGGGYFWNNNAGTNYFIHTDWLGTERLVNTVAGTTIYNDQNVAPYGQQYNVLGSAFGFFTGDIEDSSGLYLTPNRQIATNSGRWLSPDPAHSGWNAYAYVTDPNTQTDPSGLGDCNELSQAECAAAGGTNISQQDCYSAAGDCNWAGDKYNGGSANASGSLSAANVSTFSGMPTAGIAGKGTNAFLSGWTGGTGSISRPSDFMHRVARWEQRHGLDPGTDEDVDDLASWEINYFKAAGVGGDVVPGAGGGFILNSKEAGGFLSDVMSGQNWRHITPDNINRFYYHEMFEELADVAKGSQGPELAEQAGKSINMMRGVGSPVNDWGLMPQMDIHNSIIESGTTLTNYFNHFQGGRYAIAVTPEAMYEYRLSGAYLFQRSPVMPSLPFKGN